MILENPAVVSHDQKNNCWNMKNAAARCESDPGRGIPRRDEKSLDAIAGSDDSSSSLFRYLLCSRSKFRNHIRVDRKEIDRTKRRERKKRHVNDTLIQYKLCRNSKYRTFLFLFFRQHVPSASEDALCVNRSTTADDLLNS